MENQIQKITQIEVIGFKVTSQGLTPISKKQPPLYSVKRVVRCIRGRDLTTNLIVIARNSWLKRNKLPLPSEDGIFHLCVQIRDGKVIRSFYSETIQHLLKKLNYKLVILN